MKPFLSFCVLPVFLVAGAALAEPNGGFAGCTYGGSPNGAVKYSFQKMTGQQPLSAYYFVRLSPVLVASVTRVQGHSAHYTLRADFNKGEVVLKDEYVDYAPNRILTLSGSVQGERFYCEFDPLEF